MVVSKIDPMVEYEETKEIENNDVDKEVSMYEMKIFEVDVIIALGEINHSYKKYNISFSPVYIVVNELDIKRIGLYEFNSDEYTNKLDEDGELDISIIEGPLLYSFVNKAYIEDLMKNTNIDSIGEIDEEDDKKSSNEYDKIKKSIEIEEDDDDDHKEEETKKIHLEIKSKYVQKKHPIWIRSFMHSDLYDIKDNEGGGDCLFAVIRDAFKTVKRKILVKDLRELVSINATKKQFETYKDFYEQFTNGVEELDKELKKINQIGNKKSISYKKLKRDLKNGVYDIQSVNRNTKEEALKEASELHNDLKELSSKRRKMKKDKKELAIIGTDYKWMKGIKTLDDLKKFIRTCKFWADGTTINTIEYLLNIKLIVLRSFKYKDKDYDNVLSCGEMVDIRIEERGHFKPRYYILVDHTGNHYRLLLYKDKALFRFHEIPYGIKNMIKTTCLSSKGKNIYYYIPKMKKYCKLLDELPEKISIKKKQKQK
mgnify:CR=1 FL=1|tara:strand:- start:47 stop:1495 length:1449 start_codon:yes stop_codon:yes gene_type:complete